MASSTIPKDHEFGSYFLYFNYFLLTILYIYFEKWSLLTKFFQIFSDFGHKFTQNLEEDEFLNILIKLFSEENMKLLMNLKLRKVMYANNELLKRIALACPNLKYFEITMYDDKDPNYTYSEKGVKYLIDNCPNLKELNLRNRHLEASFITSYLEPKLPNCILHID